MRWAPPDLPSNAPWLRRVGDPAWVLASIGVAAAIALVGSVLVARLLVVSERGTYATLLVVVTTAAVALELGGEFSLIREYAESMPQVPTFAYSFIKWAVVAGFISSALAVAVKLAL